ncbi:VTT domain-containing protein [Haliangium ochraceum]|uniref:SNARE associated Golgi protein-like protein n=1 Tax=Haliangium ochraceum (strain DSM 14365 / JCM 11303 / SMP-2) TaxID=502025 RepID=D0LYD6_HALO1|nr:VTT domain-containing protein [Haliangium ochraceum]ACY16286.1 SNARE associated Golgi protein-like protein [Haliangium ochraceum DSM 14365]
MPDPILEPERNCWRLERARRVGILVDGDKYFPALASALEQAQSSVLILGWDVHSEICLRRGDDPPTCDIKLGRALDELAERQPNLYIRILTWDYAPIYMFEREMLTRFWMDFRRHKRVHTRLASDHPPGGAHHMKLVVIDDALAFIGGMDLTIARWDTREHLAENPRRTLPNGKEYPPFHDMQLAVDGDAARALGELARSRWEHATGEALPATENPTPLWPDTVEPDFEDIDIGIVRSRAAWSGREAITEVKTLYLDAFEAAEEVIYIENQYLTSQEICEALAERLGKDEGPEILIITPRSQAGRLEQLTMGVLRARRLEMLREADVHGRLWVVSPMVGDTEVMVHAKVLVIDDRLMRVGSANLSSRSMSLDTECDVAIEAGEDEAAAAQILRFRNNLVAEHLGVSRERVEQALEEHDSFLAAVRSLDGGGRTLVRLAPEVDESLLDLLPGDDVVDPHEPMDKAVLAQAMPEEATRRGVKRLPQVIAFVVGVLGLAALWKWSPLADWMAPERLAEMAEPLRDGVLGPLLVGLGVTVACLVMVPITVLIVATSLLYPSWDGALVALGGALLGAVIGFGLGRGLWPGAVQRVIGERLARMSEKLADRGLLTMVALRLVPIAPFTVVNMAVGSVGFRFRHFFLGTLIGLMPGLVGLTFATNRIAEAVRDPSGTSIAVAAVAVLAIVAVLWALRRWLKRRDVGNA